MEQIYDLQGDLSGSLEIGYLHEVNFVLSHGGIPTLYLCRLHNKSDVAWEDVRLRVEADDFIKPDEYIIERIGRQSVTECTSLKIEVDPQHLIGITEKIKSNLRLTLSVSGAEQLSVELSLHLMPYDHWLGSKIYPDLLACFVTPNHPALSAVLIEASKFLQKWTGGSSLSAYLTQDPNYVRLQVAAVYEALRSQGLVYSLCPASFESHGQRIRLVDQVLREKLGTCIDLTLLFASCLEAIGINTLLVLVQGHIFVGAWLESKYHISTIGDDPSFLLKGTSDGINEIVLVEATALTSSEDVGFEDAVQMAKSQICIEGNMRMFIDVYRARLADIRPLPQRVMQDGTWSVQLDGIKRSNATDVVFQLDKLDPNELHQSNQPLTKQIIWERKLLDLTLRNNLINIRLTKRIIPFLSFGIDSIEDQLQMGKQYTIHPFPGQVLVEPDSTGIFHSAQHTEGLGEFVSQEIESGRIYSYLSETELRSVLKFIYRASRNALEENGANSLFVALGLVKWYETEISLKARYAPILLLPVDIVRKNGSYIIRLRDEELILNITLIELLKQEFNINLSGLDPLPQDGSGVDVRKVLAIVRGHLRDKRRWDVLEEAMLGLFSFSKFVMWNDIHSNADKVAQHPIVQGLINQGLSPEALPALPDIDARDIDEKTSPRDYALPIDVDSSQLEAILEAGQGRSFVLHGPPGTGKSQAITNMIANALYHGKRVLFVAEKMAALSVVRRRLSKIGLDPFCLELHSNKATKSHILAQLKQTLELEHRSSPADYDRIAQELRQQRQELMAYAQALHQTQPCGLSLNECISRYLSYEEPPTAVSRTLVSTMTPDKLRQSVELIREADTILQIIGNPDSHPLKGLVVTRYDSQISEQLREVLEDWCHLWEKLFSDEVRNISTRLGVDNTDSRADYLFLGALSHVLRSTPNLNSRLLLLSEDEQTQIRALLEAGETKDTLKANLINKYSVSLLNQDPSLLSARWKTIKRQWFITRLFARWSFIKSLRQSAPGIRAIQVEEMLDELRNYKAYNDKIENNKAKLIEFFGHFSDQGDICQWKSMGSSIDIARELYSSVLEYARNKEVPASDVLSALRTLLDGGYTLLRQSLAPELTKIIETIEAIKTVEEKLITLGIHSLPTKDMSRRLPEQVSLWINNLPKLKNWYQWCNYLHRLDTAELKNVAISLEEGLTGTQAERAFMRGFCRTQAEMIIDTDEHLKLFNGMIFEQAIEKYRSLTKQFMELTKQELYVRLAGRIPRITMEPAATSEVGILKRNIGNGGRGTSIRKLIEQIPHLLPKLCPCMLMSPMSVAQYIDLDAEKFDLVIFDEASQMPTSEAVGAIARGRTLVVVGDPKQMPPTSFFASSQVEEEDVDMDDMESILDDCIALSMPSKHLTWHYRSKHESLIAFSNNNYYDGRLFTFPSVDNRRSKVTLVRIKGTYDKGRTRSNRAEAEAIVKEVLHRLKDPELSRYSIGIVSFSQVQQHLIEDLLLEAIVGHAELEQLAFGGEEPIFIKNLENVQGDERDIILFSIGYGPDTEGRISMNFGPLNNKGGERRLNVAVSRSRYEMMVFSTLRSDDIDLKRSKAKGVEGLKRFLEFAEHGRILEIGNNPSTQEIGALPELVAHELRKHGYQVDLSIGSSQFRIDLGVIDPKQSDRYLLGLLFDGESYHNTKTTRDREIVRPAVLSLLNWQIMRIWAMDWYEDKEAVIKRIIARLESPTPFSKPKEISPAPTQAISKGVPSVTEVEPIVTAETNEYARPYEFAYIKPEASGGIDLMLVSGIEVRAQLQSLIRTEQPITNTLVYKRLGAIWQISRTTARVQNFVDTLLSDYHKDPRSNDQHRFYWENHSKAEGYTHYRIDSQRDILDFPLIEIMNATLKVLAEQLSLPLPDLKRATAHLLGFSRVGGNIEMMTQMAIEQLIKEGLAENKNKMIVHKS